MSDFPVPPHAEEERIRSEASAWLARMQRPDADKYQAELQVWFDHDSRHQAAYTRMEKQLNLAAILSKSTAFSLSPQVRLNDTLRRAASLMLTCFAAAIAVWMMFRIYATMIDEPDATSMAEIAALGPKVTVHDVFASGSGHIRTVRLADGSTLALDAQSRVRVSFDDKARTLWLEQGRARFTVTHDGRPFTVMAAGGSVTARGTVFDVSIDRSNHVDVSLLQGAIDVIGPKKVNGQTITKLVAGQSVRFSTTPVPLAIQPINAADRDWPAGFMDVAAAPLSAIITQGNRYALHPIRLSDPALGSLKVSGRFKVTDATRLSRNLADLLDLSAEPQASGDIILVRR